METIFKIDNESKPKKKVLSQKQLDALEKGRQKRQQKQLEKLDKEAVKMQTDDKEKAKITKKNLLKHQEIIKDKIIDNDELLKKEKQVTEFKIKFRNSIDNKLMTIDDPKLFKEVKQYFNKYKMDDIKNIEDIKNEMRKDIDAMLKKH